MKTFAAALLATLVLGGTAAAFKVEYAGSITTGLHAPTSIVAGSDFITVLEPYADRISVYTADGRITQRVDITGDALGLAWLADSRYLFCDRARKTVVAVDLAGGEQYDFLNGSSLVTDPVDIIISGPSCFILDAGRREILIVDASGQIKGNISLNLPDGERVGFLSSFAFDRARQVFHVFDQLSSRVLMYSNDGGLLGAFCSFGGSDGAITRGGEVACDPAGYVYITDRFQGRIAVYTPEGDFVAYIDPAALGGEPLAVPTGLAVDSQGLLYVSSTEGRQIQIFHVDKTSTPDRAPLATPVHPVNFDTVATNDLWLIAGVEGSFDESRLSGIDFQLVSGTDTNIIVADGFAIAVTSRPSEGYAITAEWQPDVDLAPDLVYGWRVRPRLTDQAGEWSSWQWFVTAGGRIDYRLEQNYPNPFNAQTTIFFNLPSGTEVTMAVYNLLGQQVWQYRIEYLPAGRHQIVWDGVDDSGRPAASGVYFYRLTAAGFERTKKMVLMK